MFREMAGKARQVGLFNSTTNPTTGYVSKGLPPTNGDELVEVFKSALMYRLAQVDSMRFLRFFTLLFGVLLSTLNIGFNGQLMTLWLITQV